MSAAEHRLSTSLALRRRRIIDLEANTADKLVKIAELVADFIGHCPKLWVCFHERMFGHAMVENVRHQRRPIERFVCGKGIVENLLASSGFHVAIGVMLR